jgi:hypothetical protein
MEVDSKTHLVDVVTTSMINQNKRTLSKTAVSQVERLCSASRSRPVEKEGEAGSIDGAPWSGSIELDVEGKLGPIVCRDWGRVSEQIFWMVRISSSLT